MEDNDEPITLSAHALAALAEFNAERDVHQSKFEELKAQAEDDAQLSMTAFTEDWNESQFWYSEETAEVLANELLEASNPKTRIEHDPRFGVFSEFVYYDFQQPLKLPNELKGSLDCIICDPPFLSEDCQTKGVYGAVGSFESTFLLSL
ncbi:N-6 adenine-specific DNA methyltransferase 2 [Metarhizium anisopliae]|nr:N-6 adenine-specific DNA methyltransferase 2 [Metarhizium anisopliae]